MAKYDIKEINYITADKKQNTFNVSFCYTDDGNISPDVIRPQQLSVLQTTTFFGNIGEFDSMSQKYASNQGCLYDLNNNMIIRSLYQLPKTCLQTTAKKYGAKNTLQDIYVPPISDDVIGLCQFKNYAYGLTQPRLTSPVTFINKQLQFISKQDYSYIKQLSSTQIDTYMYPKPSEVKQGETYKTYQELIENNQSLSNAIISSIFSVKRNLKGIEYNYILEIPEAGSYNDYMKGSVQCDMVVAKNHMNYLYDMQISAENDSVMRLQNCRDYCNIGVCGNQLFATYRTNVNYSTNDLYIKYIYPAGEGMHTTPQDQILEYQMTKQRSDYDYQHVEIIESINRYDGSSNAGHKSSMFSLELIDTGLNESTISENVKEKLRQNIKNNIRAILEPIIPANTQLFEIYFKGK